MDAEILFFMSAKDQADFFEIAEPHFDSILEDPHSKIIILKVGECELLFTPSFLDDNILYIGKLEIRLSSFSSQMNIQDQEQAKSNFRKLRNWIKKHYWSRLAYINKNKKDKLTPSRNHWLGPDAKLWKEGDEANRLLKLSQTSWLVFEFGY